MNGVGKVAFVPLAIIIALAADAKAQAPSAKSASVERSAAIARPSLPRDEALEPPVAYTAELGGKSVPLWLDEPVTVDGTFTNPLLVIRSGRTRLFDYGGVSFEYPASFGWEAELDGERYKGWTLSGNDLKVMYFRTAHDFTPKAFIDSMREKFPGTTEPVEVSRDFGGIKLKGVSLVINVAGHRMKNEAYPVTAPTGSALLVFQDSDNNGNGSAEAAQAVPIITRSFKITGR